MNTPKHILFLSLLLMCMLSACSGHKQDVTTIILMRHAEKEATPNDPPLNAAGLRRAQDLPVKLKEWQPDAFYSTATQRTQQTLAPWAKQRGKTIIIYDAAKQQELADQLKAAKGQTIVVVGHSNTIPQLANLILGNNDYTDIPDADFGRVWIITIRDGHTSTELREM